MIRIYLLMLLVLFSFTVMAQKKDTVHTEPKLRQYYSGKFGYYQPDKGINNGLIVGVDGITEFLRYGVGLTGAIDFYQKQTFNPYGNPKPNIQQQALVLIPLHANIGYRLANFEEADTRMFVGLGGGYYFYFYSVEYAESSGGGLLGPGLSITNKTASENGGNVFATAFFRILIGKIFIEPRFYFATKTEKNIGVYPLTINPSGFALTLGFQYE